MAKNFIRPTTRHSLAAFFLYYFFVGLRVSAESNADKSQHEKNDFDVSIKTINGKIDVNWQTSSLWQNTTVYFLSSLHDDVTNASHAVNLTVCHAFTDDKNSWKIEPVLGNLLEFCNRSRKCGPVNTDNLIVRATLTQELSCQLFTTCTNFEDVFRIQVVSIGGGREYSFQSGNMTILSENIPPFYKVPSTSYGLPENTPITLKIIYFDPSELCGFGAKPTDNLQFVIQHYKEYDSKCFYLGQKTAPYTGKTTEVNFNDVIIRKTEVLYFDYAVISLASNKTTSSQRLKFMTDRTSSTKCSIIGGVIYISWRPQWNCFDENIIEQAQFCFYDGPCFPVCEASFFANGTFRAARTYEDEIINVCRKRDDDCKFISDQDSTKINNVSNKFINVLWSPETRRITCALFRTCMHYTYTFSVKAFSFNDGRERILDNVDVCRENTSPFENNQPAVPHGVHAIDIQANQVTITWKSPRCELEVLGCEVRVIFNGEETEKHKLLGTDGLNNIYEFTKKNLPPFEEATFQVFTRCFSGIRIGKESPLQRVITKPSAPQFAPNLISIESVDKAKGLTNIRLTWEYRGGAQYLHGVPNETRIIGLVNKTVVVYEGTINSSEKTTTLTVNQTQRCAFYQVKICNAPDLCSNYSNPPRRLRNCEIEAPTPAPESPPPSSNAFWVVIIAVVTIFIVLVAVLVTTYVYCQKRRKGMRPKLPVLAGDEDQTTADYIHMGQLSNTGEYHPLDKEEPLEQLAT